MLTTGTELYGIKIIRYCGGGGYGDVYYGEDITGRRVALKVISKVKLGSEWNRELRGITNYRKVTRETDGLLEIYHVGEDSDYFWYIMEPADCVAGAAEYAPDTLAHRLAAGRLAEADAATILAEVLQGIGALHAAGFAHRDIKPDNILFVNGKPKLADLGLLSPISGTMTKLAGTLEFMPPEQRAADKTGYSRKINQRNDLYAYGKIVYCCITGNPAGAFPSLPTDLPLTLYNKHFFRLSLRLCGREPAGRIRTIGEVEKELQRIEKIVRCGGENWSDRLRFFAADWRRQTLALASRCCRFLGLHWLVSTLGGALFMAGGWWAGSYFISSHDREVEELADTMQRQKEMVQTTLQERSFTFYNGKYALALPEKWRAISREEALEKLPPSRELERLQGIIGPENQSADRLNTVVICSVLPCSKKDFNGLSDQDTIKLLQGYLGDDILAAGIKRFQSPRLGVETILLVGTIPPAKSLVSYVYLQEEHALVLSAVLPDEVRDRDMPQFLAMTDSLIVRENP